MKTINKKNQNNLKEIPFGVPKGYFESFESRLEKRMMTESEEKEKSLRGKIIKLIKPAIGIAAGLILVLLLVNFPLKEQKFVSIVSESSVSSVEMQYEEELLAQSTDLDERTFYDVLTTSDDSIVSMSGIGDSEEVITLLSDELNDYELYAEIIN